MSDDGSVDSSQLGAGWSREDLDDFEKKENMKIDKTTKFGVILGKLKNVSRADNDKNAYNGPIFLRHNRYDEYYSISVIPGVKAYSFRREREGSGANSSITLGIPTRFIDRLERKLIELGVRLEVSKFMPAEQGQMKTVYIDCRREEDARFHINGVDNKRIDFNPFENVSDRKGVLGVAELKWRLKISTTEDVTQYKDVSWNIGCRISAFHVVDISSKYYKAPGAGPSAEGIELADGLMQELGIDKKEQARKWRKKKKEFHRRGGGGR